MRILVWRLLPLKDRTWADQQQMTAPSTPTSHLLFAPAYVTKGSQPRPDLSTSDRHRDKTAAHRIEDILHQQVTYNPRCTSDSACLCTDLLGAPSIPPARVQSRSSASSPVTHSFALSAPPSQPKLPCRLSCHACPARHFYH